MRTCGSFTGASALVFALLGSIGCSSDRVTPTSPPPAPADGGGTPDDNEITDAGSSLELRTACTFSAGTKATDSLNISEAARKKIPIEHIIVAMKENRSFDHLFGMLGKG